MTAPPFQLFGPPHVVAMAAMVAVPAALSLIVRRLDSERATRVVCISLAAVILANQVAYWIFRFVTLGGAAFLREHLPLHICGISVLLSVATLLSRRRLAYELVYFWGLAGAGNAMITPELSEGFPDYHFFQYFISHAGIVTTAIFATWGLGMRPTFGSLVRAFVGLNVLAALLAPVNLAVDGNYMYLCEAPDTASPFLFLPWPWYIPWLEGLALVFFGALYLPVCLARRPGFPAGREA